MQKSPPEEMVFRTRQLESYHDLFYHAAESEQHATDHYIHGLSAFTFSEQVAKVLSSESVVIVSAERLSSFGFYSFITEPPEGHRTISIPKTKDVREKKKIEVLWHIAWEKSPEDFMYGWQRVLYRRIMKDLTS